jgi:enoyl-CoA hydratase/carnithine racemase
LEIKLHDPKKKNAFFEKTMSRLIDLLELANRVDRVKCIVLHGGEIFSAGNDVEAFQIGRHDTDYVDAYAKLLVETRFIRFITALYDLEKPLVVLVRGFAVGISFTMLSLADFVYCTPEVKFFTPFMSSFQSPEGSSSINFPKIFGGKMANEILLLDRPITAQEALHHGFVNQVLTDIPKGEFFDLMKLPCIPKLLQNNVHTMQVAKKLMI